MQETINGVITEIRSSLRFRWYGMLIAWVICLVGWGTVATMPDVYEGTASLYVDTSSVLEPVLRNQIVTQDVRAQLQYMQETLLGRSQLEAVIDDAGLSPPDATVEQRERQIANLRSSIQIDAEGGNRNTPDNVYHVSYRNVDPAKAVGVVSALLNRFVEDTLGENRTGADTAERFLDDRVKEYETRLEKAEEALADFKKKNADRLPGAEGNYFDRLQAEREDLALANRQLRVLEAKRDQISQQLNDQAPVVSVNDLGADKPAPGSLDARILDYQARLDALLLDYTEKHPDVIALREGLNQLLAQRDAQLRALGVEGTDTQLRELGSNPIYQTLQISLNETEVEIATLKTDISERTAKINELQGLIDEVPEVEAQLLRLNRDYDVISEQYTELVRSRETQELTRKASDTDQIDFRIINPPMASLNPVAPARSALLAIVLLGGLAVGAGLCYVCSQMWPVIGSVRALRAVVQLPVLGAVTHAWDDRRRAERRRAVVAYMGVIAMLLVVYAGLVGMETLGPGLQNLVS